VSNVVLGIHNLTKEENDEGKLDWFVGEFWNINLGNGEANE